MICFNAITDENRQQLVNAGAIPVLVSLLASPDTDVVSIQLYVFSQELTIH